MANGFTTKEMLVQINDKLDRVDERINDFIEKNNNEHNKIWKSIMNLKASYSVAVVTVVAGIIFIIVKLFIK